jgi:hypothetical protein
LRPAAERVSAATGVRLREGEHVKTEARSRRVVAVGALVAVAGFQSTAMGSRSDSRQSAPRVATVALTTTQEFRVALVATRLRGASPPTAEVRVGLARRIGGSWREFGERRLGETYFWNTVSRPHAICRLEIDTVGSRRGSGSRVTVQLLLTPSVGCGRVYRFPLPTR